MSREFDTMSAMQMRRRIASKEISPIEVTRRALGLGHQYVAQRRLRSSESVSVLLFATALQLARNRGLFDPGDDLAKRRTAFLTELRTRSACRSTCSTAFRTSCPAARRRASELPAPSRYGRNWSFSMSRRPRSTSRCRPWCSICCRTSSRRWV